MLKKYSYQIHRRLAWIVFIPTLFWALSGIMHPFMSHWFKTELPQKAYEPEPVEHNITPSVMKTLLTQNQVDTYVDLHVISLHGEDYLQVVGETKNQYIAIKTGQVDPTGEKHYAEHMARYMTEDLTNPVRITPISKFTSEYKEVNRMLPVYRVSFDRTDKMDIYVSTREHKFVTFNDLKRKTFIHVFSWLHTWDFLNFLPRILVIVLMLVVLVTLLLTAISGLVIYGFFYKIFKQIAPEKINQQRYRHRMLGLVFSFFVFTFAFSGAYHVYIQLWPKNKGNNQLDIQLQTRELPDSSSLNLSKYDAWGIVNFQGKPVLQTLEKETQLFTYLDLESGDTLTNGNAHYTAGLIQAYLKKRGVTQKIAHQEWIIDFTNEYGFINKHLPVMRYQLNDLDSTTFYLDPACQKVTAEIKASDRLEGFSFAFLHKFHFLDGLGKNFRDGLLVFFAFAIALTTYLGMRLLKRKH